MGGGGAGVVGEGAGQRPWHAGARDKEWDGATSSSSSSREPECASSPAGARP